MTTTKRFSRRSFLKSAAVVASTAPFILPSHIWAADVKPNDRLTLGFIGVGTQGRGLLSGFLGKKETQNVAISDDDTTRREHSKKTVEDFYAKQANSGYKGCQVYNDFRELIGRK